MKSVLKKIRCRNCRSFIEEHDKICISCGFDFVNEKKIQTRYQSEQFQKGRFHIFGSLTLLSLTFLAEHFLV